MIRLKRLVLDDMRNISHGVLDFDDLPAGGSVTGIYGQNGSGKTTVIDAIGMLRALLSGAMLPENAGDVVNASTGVATMTATFLIDEVQKRGADEEERALRYLEYRVSVRKTAPDSTRARVVAESVRIGDDPSRLGREVMGHRMDDAEVGFVSTPAYVWRSIESIAPVKAVVSRTADRAYMEGRSFLFSRCATLDERPEAEFLIDWTVARMREAKGVSSRSMAYINERFGEFVRLREALCGYATNDIFVSTTRRGSYAAYAYIPIMEENPTGRNTEFLFDLLQPKPLTPGQAERLGRTVASFDRILPTIVPGLHVLLKTGTAPSGRDGEDRVTAELFSRRSDVTVPFRCESEGIIRVTALLGYLKHAYNDENALVAVDEFDSGVFELLLGDMLYQLADGCAGQLVFTAHNLRALEVLPNSCIRTTVTDPDNRFATVPRQSSTNNQRKRYLSASELGWNGPDIYDSPTPRMFGNSLYAAGHPDDDDDTDIDADLAALNADVTEAGRG
ncbi:AAA family ATPase [Bifidobacterium samirii]|uniref:ATPase for DNA repair n=1 Tax=Bifidobacterium samirii TaxID=2306974 RepID=A0A430FU09_9BIFI|nr:AAA family ATPase [Bifidobacterium samirii]RSX56355.1 ATPase for DNA repair [Bifidobacterium samirii]